MIEFEDNRIVLNVDRCIYCNSKNIVKLGDIVICRDCGESFSKIYEFENPKDCDHCGYLGDCIERFRFCPFDGEDVNKKLIESWMNGKL